jgi:hypothetical protein
MIKLKAQYIAVVLAFALLVVLFPHAVFSPNTFLFGGGGDGLKNAVTFVYHLQNGTGLHYNGMNYPYGEHAAFADAQVGILWPTMQAAKVFPAIKNFGFAVLNIFMLLNCLLSTYFFTKIIKYYKAKDVIAIIGGIFITFFSPQIFRMFGHYALSYSAIYAAALWYTLQLIDGKYRFAFYVFLLMFFGGLLHFYHVAIIGMFLGSLFCIKAIEQKLSINSIVGLTATIAGVASVLIFNKLTDNIVDRPSNPWGFFACNANLRSVFLPHPKDLLVVGSLKKDLSGFSEGFAYIGLLGLVFCVICTVHLLVSLFKKRLNYSGFDMPIILASIATLLFSMNFPWVLGLSFVVDYIPFIKQFRSTGRFAWIFFYVVNIFLFVNIKSIWQFVKTKNVLVRYGVMFLILVASFEFVHRLNRVHMDYKDQSNSFNNFLGKEAVSKVHSDQVIAKNYQALLVLPFFHIGSEKFAAEEGASIYEGLRNSLLLHLPLIDVMMSRTSMAQSLKTMQLLSENTSAKLWYNDVHDTRPILLMVPNKPLDGAQARLLQMASLIDSTTDITWYSLPLDAFKKLQLNVDSICNATKKYVQHQNFASDNDTSMSKVYFAKVGARGKDIAEQRFPVRDTDSVEIGVWIKCRPLDQALPSTQIHLLDKEGAWLGNYDALGRNCTEVFNGISNGTRNASLDTNNTWVMLHLIIPPKVNASQLKVFFEADVECTNVFVRPLTEHINYTYSEWLYFDGLPTKKLK